MRVVFTRRVSRHKMWWGCGRGRARWVLGAVTGLDMAEWLSLTSDKFLILSTSAMSRPVAAPKPIWPSHCHTLHHILCLDIILVNTKLISAHTCTFGAGKFCDDMTCVLPSISQLNLYQIQLLGGVLEQGTVYLLSNWLTSWKTLACQSEVCTVYIFWVIGWPLIWGFIAKSFLWPLRFSVAKVTLELLMSCWDVVMLNQRCGYVKKYVVMLSVTNS